MKNLEIVTLVTGGVHNLTAHSLDAVHAFRLVKFKSELEKSYAKFKEDDNALLLEIGIEDPYAFDKRHTELKNKASLTKAEKQELVDLNLKIDRLTVMRNTLANEPVELDGVKPMPYEQWKKLQDENHNAIITIDGKSIEILTLAEPVLENILWTAPEE